MVDSGWRLEEIGRGQFFKLFWTFEDWLRVNGDGVQGFLRVSDYTPNYLWDVLIIDVIRDLDIFVGKLMRANMGYKNIVIWWNVSIFN